MKMEGEDILSLARRRKEDRRKSEGSGVSSANGYVTSIPNAKSNSANFAASLNAGLNRATLTPRKYPSEAVLRIDNFTSADNSPLSLSPTPTPPRKAYEPKGFLKDVVTREPRAPLADLFPDTDGAAVSRNSLPPLVTVEVLGATVAALLHSAMHASLMSGRLVTRLGLKKDVQTDASMPAPPLAPNGSGSAWLVEGRLRYVEVSLKGAKFVTQLFVARDLPADIILGVDFLRKSQMRLNFPESCVTFSSGGEELKLPFLSSKEVSDHQHEAASAARAYSSNF